MMCSQILASLSEIEYADKHSPQSTCHQCTMIFRGIQSCGDLGDVGGVSCYQCTMVFCEKVQGCGDLGDVGDVYSRLW